MAAGDLPAEREVAEALAVATREAIGGAPGVSVLYSGGIDSSLVAVLAARETTVHLVAIGVRNARDLADAATGARLLGLPLTAVELSDSDVRGYVEEVGPELTKIPPPLRGVALGLSIAIERSPDPRVLCGQGADELFFGYAHFRGLSEAERRERAEADWRALVDRDWPWARARAERLGHTLRAPFLASSVVEAARRLPFHRVPVTGLTKPSLRRIAKSLGVPVPIVERPKRAFQYGSGLHRALAPADVEPAPEPAMDR